MIIEGLDAVVVGLMSEITLAEPRAEDAVQHAADAMADDARQLAPRRTGALANSIEVTRSGLEAEVGPTVPYARFVEFGTYKDAPQPFMGPASSMHEDDMVRELERTVGVL